jgi:hypothetical protein
MARQITLWITGLLAFSASGGLIGNALMPYGGAFWGVVGGASAFTCLRLWLTEKKSQPSN